MNLGPIAKAVNGAVVAVLLAFVGALQDGNGISAHEWISIAITLVAAALLIFEADNLKVFYAKAIAGALTAALGTLGTLVSNGGFDTITTSEWLTVLVALLGNAIVVSQTPNAVVSTSDSTAVAARGGNV